MPNTKGGNIKQTYRPHNRFSWLHADNEQIFQGRSNKIHLKQKMQQKHLRVGCELWLNAVSFYSALFLIGVRPCSGKKILQ